MSENNTPFGSIVRAKETERYLVQMVMHVWQALIWTLGLGQVFAGVILATGPSRFRASPNYGIFDILRVPEQIFPITLAVSGALIIVALFWRSVLFSVVAHTISFVALFWWGFMAFGFLIDGQSSTGSGTFYVLMLAGVHICIVVAKLRAWYLVDGGRNERR